MWWNQYWGLMPLDPSKLSTRKLNKMRNNLEFLNFFEFLYTLTVDMFGYEGFPDTCDERFFERSNLLYGQASIVRPEKDIKMPDGTTLPAGTPISPAVANGANLNLYGYSLKVWGYGLNGFNHEFRAYVPGADDAPAIAATVDGYPPAGGPEAVICFDNVTRYPYINYIFNTARRLADLVRACDVAVQNLKSPYFIVCDDTQKTTVQDALKMRDENVATIFAIGGGITLDNFKLLPTNMDHEILKEFWQQFRNILSQFLETIGYDANADTDKRERLLVDEVNANNDLVQANFLKRYHQRRLWCDRVNKLWGWNIQVKPRREAYRDELEQAFGTDGLDQGERDRSVVRGDQPGSDDAGGDR